jgi:hypothetical protein
MIKKERIQLAALLFLTFIVVCQAQTADKQISDIREKYRLINEDFNLIVDTIDLVGESSEGGFLIKMKDSKGNLNKMVVDYYGETGQLIEEYYIMEGRLFFCFTKQINYNRPIYYDKKMAADDGDNEAYDSKKNKIEETRYYFDTDQKLILMINKNRVAIHDKEKIADSEAVILQEYRRLNLILK